MAEEKKSGFTVTDRRFVAGDDVRAEGENPAAPGTGAPEVNRGGVPKVDFPTFILSLGSSALLHLGEIEHPETGQPQRDLPLAKHTIDIISMLEEKTRGNLTPDEQRLVESLLFDLRLKYIEATKK